MSTNKQKGNMYGFVTRTWNPIKGVCPHQCSYCYMRRWWPQMKAPRLCEKEFKTDLESGHTIFIGSGTDMFADAIPTEWIDRVMEKLNQHQTNAIKNGDKLNRYLFQTKNPKRFRSPFPFPRNTILCTTIETDRYYKDIMGKTITPRQRYIIFRQISKHRKMVTIEPVMDFDFDIMLKWMININPIQINIGADSGGNHLPEPSKEKLQKFVQALKQNNLRIYEKPNLKRLLK